MNPKIKRIIAREELAIILFLLVLTSSVFPEEFFNIEKGVTTKKEVTDKWGEPNFKKIEDGIEYSYYESDDKIFYIVISYDYQGKVSYYGFADKTTMIACPNCFRFYTVKVRDSFESIYTCDNCGYKFSKTEGIGAFDKRIMDFAILQAISQRR